MKTIPSLLLLSAALAVSATAHATIERNIEKSYTVSGAGTIHLHTGGGGIKVTSGSDGVVKVIAHEKIRADSDSEADDLLKDLELTFDQSGNDVTAKAKWNRTMSGFHFGWWPPVQVSFEAIVPASYAADLHTSGGGIQVGDLSGAVFARTSGGGIELGKMGGKVDVHTSGGGITLKEARESAKLDTSGGNISVGRVAGPAELSTSGGGIRIDSVEQSVRAHTSGGSVHAGIVGPVKGDCELSSSGGSIHVTVDKTAAFHLDASTSGGGVHADGLTITLKDGDHSRSRLNGDVNGGGPEVKLRTSGGSINVDVR